MCYFYLLKAVYNNTTIYMRKIQGLFMVMAFVMVACSGGQSTDEVQPETAIDSSRLVTVKYSVEGMTCTGCENTINFSLGEMPGVTEVTSSHQEMYTLVTYDSGLVTPEMIGKDITARGYTFKGEFPEVTDDSNPDQPEE
jgi:copper chaperone CopZ